MTTSIPSRFPVAIEFGELFPRMPAYPTGEGSDLSGGQIVKWRDRMLGLSVR